MNSVCGESEFGGGCMWSGLEGGSVGKEVKKVVLAGKNVPNCEVMLVYIFFLQIFLRPWRTNC